MQKKQGLYVIVNRYAHDLMKELCTGRRCIDYLLKHVEPPYEIPPVRDDSNYRHISVLEIELLEKNCKEFNNYSECIAALIHTAHRRGIVQPIPKENVKIALPKEVWDKIDSLRGRLSYTAFIEKLLDGVDTITPVVSKGFIRAIAMPSEYLSKLREKCPTSRSGWSTWKTRCLAGLLLQYVKPFEQTEQTQTASQLLYVTDEVAKFTTDGVEIYLLRDIPKVIIGNKLYNIDISVVNALIDILKSNPERIDIVKQLLFKVVK